MSSRGSIDRVIAAADEIISLVRALPELGGERSDTSSLFVYGAFLRGFRRFIAIRNVADGGFSEETAILTRSLVSIVARAVWIDQPADSDERRERFQRLLRRQHEDDLYGMKLSEAAGWPVDADAPRSSQAALDELVALGVKSAPPDRELFREVDMDAFYARIYAPALDRMHFSVDTAIADIFGVQSVALEEANFPRAAEFLTLAIMVFGLLLERSERVVHHGITSVVAPIAEGLLTDLEDIFA